MPEIVAGQQVRIKTADELMSEFGFDLDDIDMGVQIGELEFTRDMKEYCGGVFTVSDYDRHDGCVYIGDTDYWWDLRMVVLVSEPGCICGFKVGDQIEFRQYEDMVADGSIEYNAFTEGMQYLCGTRGTIVSIAPINGCRADITVRDADGNILAWSIDTTMVEHIDDSCDIDVECWQVIAFA